MNQDQLNAALAASPSPNRITPEYLQSRISMVEFLDPENTTDHGTLTICIVTMDNGFQVTGVSACADVANYNQEIGRKISQDNAERQIWPLLGFMLREALWRKEQGA